MTNLICKPKAPLAMLKYSLTRLTGIGSLCLFSTMLGCSPKGQGTATGDFQDTAPYVMRIAHVQPIDHPRNISLMVFERIVKERTGGNIIVKISPNGELGTEKEMLEQVSNGTIQGFRGGEVDYIPRLLLLSLPFLTQNSDEIERLCNSDFTKSLCEASLKTGTIILGIGDAGGYRQLSCNAHPIHGPKDIQGLSIRSNGMDTIDATFQAMGARTSTIPYNELYMSLKTGVVDGQENSWVNVATSRLYEVQRYFVELNYQFHPDPFYVNLKWWNNLPKEYQAILIDATHEMFRANREAIAENEEAAKAQIRAHADIYVPSKEEKEDFIAAAQKVYEDYIAQGRLTRAELETMRSIVKGKP